MIPAVDEILKLYSSGDSSPSEITRLALDAMESSNELLNAYLTINRTEALKTAKGLDASIRESSR